MELRPYIHKIQYYETDKMGITHHSNYIRWMEEARGDFLEQIGWDYDRLEELGVVCPVVSVECRFRETTTFPQKITITLSILECRGAKLTVGYVMTDENGKVVLEGSSSHAFLYRDGKFVRLKKDFPVLYGIFDELASAHSSD